MYAPFTYHYKNAWKINVYVQLQVQYSSLIKADSDRVEFNWSQCSLKKIGQLLQAAVRGWVLLLCHQAAAYAMHLLWPLVEDALRRALHAAILGSAVFVWTCFLKPEPRTQPNPTSSKRRHLDQPYTLHKAFVCTGSSYHYYLHAAIKVYYSTIV